MSFLGLPPSLTLTALVVFTGLLYAQHRRQPKEPGRPKVAPYWIPWIGSALSMGLDTDGFLLKNARRYGPAFFVDVIGVRFLYIVHRDPIKWALRRPRDISIRNVEFDSLQAIFDISKEAAAQETANAVAFKTLSRDTTKWSVKPTVACFNEIFQNGVEELKAGFTKDELANGKVIGFADVFLPVIYNAFSKAALGRNYAGTPFWKSHNEFHDAFPVLFSGMPKILAGAGIKGRDHLWKETYKLLLEHLKTDDPKAHDGPIFMKILAKVIDQQPDMDMHDAAKMVNLYMFAGDNIGLGSFWIVSRILAHTGLYAQLSAEIERAWQGFRARTPTIVVAKSEGDVGVERPVTFADMLNDLETLDRDLPLLNSVFKEMTRFHGKQMFVRRAETDMLLPVGTDDEPDKTVVVQKGDNIILYMRPTHFREDTFKDPHTFRPDRFVSVDGKDVGEIDESKSGFMVPFGFGTTVCPGRYLASFEIKSVVIWLLHAFDIEHAGLTGLSRFLPHQTAGMDKPVCRQNLATFGTPLSMPFGDQLVKLKPKAI
ncbi:cytochrome P450 [Punctularia strigosozonata HHB-11173 SS5]|uniref:cytochrome P450 n=1 Tax=Punctularia strigosozonata (strain HHB-11173) TaxID=741275 RepID=UPI00044164C0|nr:cytochrome P450 [Punctularia strigosozonata HHB-11173 SS5]EIN09896.1 cytochrome P450 [Punctularia strigosozonata HHB-11173 SS5]